MPKRVITAILCAMYAPAAQMPPRDSALLGRIRRHMQQRLAEVPNYTCTETIERLSRPRGARRFEPLDTVRLEVAQVGRTELLAWPGGKFESKPLSAFVPSGLMSNGAFVMHSRSLFLDGRAHFRYAGAGKLVHFEYQVPRERSGYRIRAFGQTGIVGYHGSFWADPGSLDVLRLEVYADAIPESLHMLKAETIIEYQRIRIGAAEALLPKTAELTVTRPSRVQERNRIVFSGCRQYGSESMITYMAPQEGSQPVMVEPAAGSDAQVVTLAAGLRLALVLETTVDAAQAAIGTPVEASVVEDVVNESRVAIPHGAKVSGRVRQIRRVGKPVRAIEVGIEFTEVRWSGARAQLAAGLEEIASEPGLRQTTSGWSDDSLDPPRIGRFYVHGPAFQLPAGARMTWKTLAPAAAVH